MFHFQKKIMQRALVLNGTQKKSLGIFPKVYQNKNLPDGCILNLWKQTETIRNYTLQFILSSLRVLVGSAAKVVGLYVLLLMGFETTKWI
ncbi:hypothetical protein CGH88_23955 [Vibrio parahaemolyticus]|nr:hypothetical protein CGH88_23955 [Vibrio parahaemolyticus]